MAEWLEADARVAYVNFSGLPSHPHYERAQKYLPLGPGSVFSFGVKGGRAAGQKFIEALQLASHLANVGDSRTLVIHPGSTTHQQLSPDQLESAGVPEDLVRISVGPRGHRRHPLGPGPGAGRGVPGDGGGRRGGIAGRAG